MLAGITLLGLTTVAACGDDTPPLAPTDDVAAALASSCGGDVADWATLITEAQQEGALTIAGPPNPTVNKDVADAFKRQFGITVTYNAGTSGQTAQKIQAERTAGIHSLDIFLAGGNTMSNVIYESGWLTDLRSALVSPKLTEAATWHGIGSKAPFVDEPNFTSVAKLSIQGQEQFMYNTDLVREGELTAWKDLLDPKWRGKIVAMDPTKGAGLGFNVVLMLNGTLGFDFIEQLYKGQQVVLQTDDRQAADAVAKGQYAIAIGVSEANGQLGQLIEDGLPVRVISRPDDTPQMISAGYGLYGLMDKAPHPNAAKLFANWLLCPDGNRVWNTANGYQSTRVDIDIEVSEHIKADVDGEYWDTYGWQLLTSDQTDQLVERLRTSLR